MKTELNYRISGRSDLAILFTLAGLSIVFIIGTVLMLALDQDLDAGVPEQTPDHEENNHNPAHDLPKSGQHEIYAANNARLSIEDQNEPPSEFPDMDTAKSKNLGDLFENKYAQDLARLGPERHKRMEQFWLSGRRPRGDAKSIEKLETLLSDYPNTNRAGCAAYELGHHYIQSKNLDISARRKQAESYWRLVDERYRDSICEYNMHTAANSKMALASWVYRYTDPALARRLLNEIIQMHQGETDHLGQSLGKTVRTLLQQLN